MFVYTIYELKYILGCKYFLVVTSKNSSIQISIFSSYSVAHHCHNTPSYKHRDL